MNLDQARLLAENLVERFERDEATGKLRLLGPVSEREYDALLYLLAGSPVPPCTDAAPHPVARHPAAETNGFVPDAPDDPVETPDLVLSSLEAARKDYVILCLDFGTAFSKAAATDGSDEKLIELALGRRAGEPDHVYAVSSSLYMTGGTLFFGPQAVLRSRQEQDPAKSRFDSPKQWISRGDVEQITHRAVDPQYNDSGVRFTIRDYILLYLSYLTDLACSELHDAGFGRYVPRRFARPSWDPERAEWANDQFERMLSQAQVIADTFSGKWTEGIPASVARGVLDKLEGADALRPKDLVISPVLEATAAAASALTGVGGRELCVVVDIGAGTTDVAAFYAVKNRDGVRVAEIEGTQKVLRQAGDTLDKCLKAYILQKHEISQNDQEGRQISSYMERWLRSWKEDLFKNGSLGYSLSNDIDDIITIDEFLAFPQVRRFAEKLEETLCESLRSIDGDILEHVTRVSLVLTGGGASLPMAKSLENGVRQLNGRQTRCTLREATPGWLESRFPSLVPIYPQMAVAIGGTADPQPAMVRSVSVFGANDRDQRFIPPSYRGI